MHVVATLNRPLRRDDIPFDALFALLASRFVVPIVPIFAQLLIGSLVTVAGVNQRDDLPEQAKVPFVELKPVFTPLLRSPAKPLWRIDANLPPRELLDPVHDLVAPLAFDPAIEFGNEQAHCQHHPALHRGCIQWPVVPVENNDMDSHIAPLLHLLKPIGHSSESAVDVTDAKHIP